MTTTGITRTWRGGRSFPLFGSFLALATFTNFANWQLSRFADTASLLGLRG